MSWISSAFSDSIEDHGPPGRHDAQRLVRRIQHERPAHCLSWGLRPHTQPARLAGARRSGELAPLAHRLPRVAARERCWRSNPRHHSSHVTTSPGSGSCSGSPYIVTARNRRYVAIRHR